MTPTNMGYLEMELPIVSSQHGLAALMLASLSTCHIRRRVGQLDVQGRPNLFLSPTKIRVQQKSYNNLMIIS